MDEEGGNGMVVWNVNSARLWPVACQGILMLDSFFIERAVCLEPRNKSATVAHAQHLHYYRPRRP
jgi:hypothetical protein